MHHSESIRKIELLTPGTHSLPLVKQQIETAWICRITQGTATVSLNFREYALDAADEEILFLVADGMNFKILRASEDCQFETLSIEWELLSPTYCFLSNDANRALSIPSLVTTQEMLDPFNSLVQAAYCQLDSIVENSTAITDADNLILHQLIATFILFYNGISQWEVTHRKEADKNMANTTQGYRIMARLFEIFNEPEALRHRDAQYFASRLNISPRYFYEICVQEAGMTPKAFINDAVMSQIKHQLLTTTLSLQEISLMFDFPDQTAFTQYFKRNEGLTPSTFRQQYK